MQKGKATAILLTALLALSFVRCSQHQAQTSFVTQKRAIGGQAAVLLIPLKNMSGYQLAATETEKIIEQQLGQHTGLRLIGAAQTKARLEQERIPGSLVDRRVAVYAGRLFKADFAIMGTVLEYGSAKTLVKGKIRGSEPVVSLHLRVVDLLNQSVAYATVGSAFAEQGLSFKHRSTQALMQRAVRDCLQPFFNRVETEKK